MIDGQNSPTPRLYTNTPTAMATGTCNQYGSTLAGKAVKRLAMVTAKTALTKTNKKKMIRRNRFLARSPITFRVIEPIDSPYRHPDGCRLGAGDAVDRHTELVARDQLAAMVVHQ